MTRFSSTAIVVFAAVACIVLSGDGVEARQVRVGAKNVNDSTNDAELSTARHRQLGKKKKSKGSKSSKGSNGSKDASGSNKGSKGSSSGKVRYRYILYCIHERDLLFLFLGPFE